MRFVTININERCPLKCRHCSIGFSESNRGTSYRITPEQLDEGIGAIDPAIYEMVLFAGGEPSLDPDLLRVGVDACKRTGLKSGIVTAPIWGASSASAQIFLDKVAGLDFVIASYDYYHLEFLKFRHYETAIREAAGRGINVIVEITYSRESEKQELIASLDPVHSLLTVSAMRTLPVGNAANNTNVEMEYVTVNSIEDLDSIPRCCILGRPFIDKNAGIHGCCWSSTAENSPFSFNAAGRPLQEAFNEMENSPVFRNVMHNGFLNALSAEGKENLVDLVRGQRFCNECDICVTAMKKNATTVWEECSASPVPVAAVV